MAHIKPQYRSKHMAQALAHLAEELAEAGAAVAKSIRFGLYSVNPELAPGDQEPNMVRIRREMKDVVRAYCQLDKLLAKRDDFELGELTDDVYDALSEPGGDPVHDQ